MKHLETFFLKTKLIYVWVISSFICSFIWILFWLFLGSDLHTHKIVKLCLTMGCVLGSVVTCMVYLMRGADKFFRKAELVEKLIEDAKTKEDILEIYDGEFKKLRDLSFHRETGYRLREIHSVMKVKYKFLPNK